jgi:hypothetical protein
VGHVWKRSYLVKKTGGSRCRSRAAHVTAHEAQTGQIGQILRVQNRSGNVHDGKGSLGFLRSLSAVNSLRGRITDD